MKTSSLALMASMAIAMPGMAFAQNMICGVSTSQAIVVGSDITNADISNISDPIQVTAQLSGAGPVYYQFDVSSMTEVRIEASDSDGADPVLTVLNANGSEVAGDDDGGGGRSSRVETMLSPGTYCAQVNVYGNQAGTALLQFGRTDQEALTPGVYFGGEDSGACTADTIAEPLTPGSLNAALGMGGMVELTRTGSPTYHRFSLDAPMALTLSARNQDADPVLRLYDNNGVLIVENDDFDGLNAQIDQQSPLPAGAYCLGVSALSDSNAPITVSVSEFDPVAFINGRYDRAEAAPPIGGTYPVQMMGSLSTSLSADIFVGDKAIWAAFDLPEASMVVLEIIGNGTVDPVVTLFNERGTQIGQNDDGPSSYDSQLALELASGRYLFAITQYDDTGSGVVRAFAQRYVKAQ